MYSRSFKRLVLVALAIVAIVTVTMQFTRHSSDSVQQAFKFIPSLSGDREDRNVLAADALLQKPGGKDGNGALSSDKTKKKSSGAVEGLAALGFTRKKPDEQIELEKKLTAMTKKLVDEQEKRIVKLEKERQELEGQLDRLRIPSEAMSLREKLAYVYPYDGNRKFPAYIWQSWKYGVDDDKFGKQYELDQEQWVEKNPGFVHEIFNDDTANAFVHYLYINVPDVVEAYESLPNNILKIDLFRYLILFARGGIWADIDTFPVKPIPNWIPDNVDPTELGMILGVDYDTQGEVDDNLWKATRARKFQFGNGIIQAKPGHPILRELIAKITEVTLRKKKLAELQIPETRTDIAIMNWTGEGVFTDVILQVFNNYVLSGVSSRVSWKDFHELEVPKLVSDVLVMPQKAFMLPYGKKEGAEDDEDAEDQAADDADPMVMVRHKHAKVYEHDQ